MWQKTWSVLLVATVVRCLEFDIQNHWNGGFNGQLTFPIPRDVDGWKIHLIFNQPIGSIESPEAEVTQLNDREFILSNKGFNGHEQAGQQLNLNFMAKTTGNIHPHACAYMEGLQEGTCTHPTVTIVPPGSSTSPGVICHTINPTAMYTSTASTPPSTVYFTPADTTPQPATTQPPAPTTQPPAPTTQPPAPTIQPPTIQPPTTQPPAPTTQPPAPTTQPPAPTTQPPAPTTQPPAPTTQPPAPTETITPPSETAASTGLPTASVSVSQPPTLTPDLSTVTDVDTTTSMDVSTNLTSTTVSDVTGKDYGDALGKSILFYDAQRSGKLPANNPVPWRGDSALDDCVVGGWYDAGDHVKFGLPFGATTHLLLWGMDLFKDGYQQSGQLDEAYDMIKWATDYMLNAWNPSTQELVAQIGDGNADHSFWGRAEDMMMNRPCYKLGPGKPGSDVAGEWAAALAAGSLVFRDKGDTAYADQLLNASREIYDFAKANPGTYTSSVPDAGSFYASSGYQDEMCEGGAWLYRATQEPQYLTDAVANYQGGNPWALSWDDKKAACDLLLYQATNDDQYKNDIEGFFSDWMPGGQVPYTPCGLAWRDKWGANRYAGNSAFLALAAAEAGINTDAYRKWGVEQINFLLGDNNQDGGCFSFEIGYGSKYPMSPHHRSASCPNIPQPCSDANLHSSDPSPHLLEGALVGGPDQSGHYVDNREDYVMNEVAIDYNSGFHSALAGVNHLQATRNMPATDNQCPCSS